MINGIEKNTSWMLTLNKQKHNVMKKNKLRYLLVKKELFENFKIIK